MLSKFSKDTFSSLPIFHQAVFSSATKPIPVVAARVSWISYFHNPSLEAKSTVREISDQLVFSCIDHICQNFLDTVESLAPELGASEHIFHCFAAQQNFFSIF